MGRWDVGTGVAAPRCPGSGEGSAGRAWTQRLQREGSPSGGLTRGARDRCPPCDGARSGRLRSGLQAPALPLRSVSCCGVTSAREPRFQGETELQRRNPGAGRCLVTWFRTFASPAPCPWQPLTHVSTSLPVLDTRISSRTTWPLTSASWSMRCSRF